MNFAEVRMDKVKEIMANILDFSIAEINNETSPETAENWDSFNHLLLITAIEQELGIKFTMDEVASIKSYAILEDLVRKKNG